MSTETANTIRVRVATSGHADVIADRWEVTSERGLRLYAGDELAAEFAPGAWLFAQRIGSEEGPQIQAV
ncbi:hypothetical protein [uncultured Arthrobacter sp.]|uniref:hypothetical protein n=1 Tax=uncultured Arthrobacter sp. TaxID=114050 RepID=UPI0025F95616|nr:hypothetical protein [uncultured Arthrobacter sp.]